ncbi:MAG: hypothetical protein ABEJ65_05165 [bacterium]
MTDRQSKWLKNISIGFVAFFLYTIIVWVYFQYETFAPGQPDISFVEAIWYVILNPTNLGSTTTKLFPSTVVGQVIAVVFTLTSIGLLGIFIGKISDMFLEFREQARLGRHRSNLSNHVVILGWDEYSRRVTRELVHSDIDTVVVTADKNEIDLIRETFNDDQCVFPVFANYDNFRALDQFSDITRSSRVFLNRRADTDTLITLFNLHDAFSDANLSYVARVRNSQLIDRFDLEHKDIDVTPVWSFGVASALIASYIYEPEVATLERDFITAYDQGSDYEIQQYQVGEKAPWVDQSYNKAFNWFFERGIYSIGLAKHQNPDSDRLVLLPDGEKGSSLKVEVNDYILVALESKQIDSMEQWSGHSKGIESVAAES